ETIKKGINEAFNPGRFEIIKTSPYIILDGAHNYDGTKALVNSVLNIFPNKKIKVLFSAMQDKEYVKMLEELEKLTKEITITRLDYHRVFDIDNLNYHKIKDPIEAYNTLLNNLKEEEVLLVTGSLYFVSFIRNYLNL
ncbi:MAG: bifunctional folylpolyglutamate synthase/dihydrofolate synthase, partial [Acholeplasmataceae bacterium]|nr:bifunctional folylpolyglutamate synthase/dihydrofolate synthase [Acholeplasmataceae bacterium]